MKAGQEHRRTIASRKPACFGVLSISSWRIRTARNSVTTPLVRSPERRSSPSTTWIPCPVIWIAGAVSRRKLVNPVPKGGRTPLSFHEFSLIDSALSGMVFVASGESSACKTPRGESGNGAPSRETIDSWKWRDGFSGFARKATKARVLCGKLSSRTRRKMPTALC